MPTDPACRPWSRRDSLAELDAHDDGDLDVAAPDAEVRPRRSRLPVALALAGVALVLAGGAIVLGVLVASSSVSAGGGGAAAPAAAAAGLEL